MSRLDLRWELLLPKLQSLDHLINHVDWRERLVATCLKDKTQEERNRVLVWCGAGLGGLRWEAVSGFCKHVPLFIATKKFGFDLTDDWYAVGQSFLELAVS